MKNIFKFTALLLLLALLVLPLVSCGEPEGTYTDEYGLCSYTFDGKRVEVKYEDYSFEYFFEIEKRADASYIIFYDIKTGEEAIDALEYEEGDGFLMIGGIKYIKQK